MDSNEIKALVDTYLVARDECDAAPDDECLEWAMDALYYADAIVRALKPLLDK